LKSKVRWGVIGAGGIARRRTIPEGILPAANAELISVCSASVESGRQMAAQFDAEACANDAELLRTNIDAVYIATPVHLHLRQVRQVAAAGKHVFCEKPLGMNPVEARRMLVVCKRAKVKLGTAFMMRNHSQHQAALQMVRDGKIGKPVYARAQLSCWYPPLKGSWRQAPKLGGGGALMDLAGHCIDLLEMFLGPVRSVNCVVANRVHKYKSDDTAVTLVRFRDGAVATVDTCFNIPDNSSKNRLELYGSGGSILAEGTIGQGSVGKMVAFLEGTGVGYDARQARAAADGIAITPSPVNLYLAEIEAFSQAILDDEDTSESAMAGLRSQIILAACYKSAKTGREVKV
jgi:predicted dehydrogenase